MDKYVILIINLIHKINQAFCCFLDLSDCGEVVNSSGAGSVSPQALNYSTLGGGGGGGGVPAQVDPGVSSTETLLRNIQGLLKVAADNARQQERQINYEKGKPEHSSY
jgi:hypothetical protein